MIKWTRVGPAVLILVAGLLLVPVRHGAARSCIPPVAAFSWQTERLRVHFSNESDGTSPDFSWTLGDGATSSAISPTHTYALPGEYTVTLLALNNCGGDLAEAVVVVEEGERIAFLPSLVVGVVPATPQPTPTPRPTPTPPGDTPTPTPTPLPDLSVVKVGVPRKVEPGDRIVFTIGLINRRPAPVQVTIGDTFPLELEIVQVWADGDLEHDGRSLWGTVTVPGKSTAQVYVAATVTDPCGCYVVNTLSWSGGGEEGRASSPPIWIED